MMQYSEVVRQRDELRIRIQHLLHILHNSQVAFEEQTKENQVLRHALSQGSVGTDGPNATSFSHKVLATAAAPDTAHEYVYL
jgi:dihydropteroate synthase